MSNSKKSQQSDEEFLKHIITEITRVSSIMNGKSIHDLESDWELEHKVTRSLEIMGEASARISASLKKHFPEIPWQIMKDLRNRVIHEYFEINFEIVFNVVNVQLPPLNEKLEKVNAYLQENPAERRNLLSKNDLPLLVKTRDRSSKKIKRL